MRRSLLLGVAAVACLAAVAHAAPAGPKTVSIPLPAPQAAEIATFKVTVKGGGILHVKTANDSALGNLALVYAIGRPTKAGATSTWVVDVLIKRFTALRRSAVASAGTVQLSVESTKGTFTTTVPGNVNGCKNAEWADKVFEGGGTANSEGMTYALQNGRSESEQPSPPEEVLDNIVASMTGCTFKPEGDDPGNK